jgi:Arc/MetJ-type ribon-helix-helix transcriptional regulator
MPLTSTADLAIIRIMDDSESVRIITPMPRSLVEAIDDYRFAGRFTTRAAAMRKLLEDRLAEIGSLTGEGAVARGRRRKAPDEAAARAAE